MIPRTPFSFIFSIAALATVGITPPTTATIRPSLYLPNDDFCAVYQGNIGSERLFTLWADAKRKLTITLNQDLKVAVLQGGKLIPPFAIDPQPNPLQLEQSFRTVHTGNHQIVVRGAAQNTTITFCIR